MASRAARAASVQRPSEVIIGRRSRVWAQSSSLARSEVPITRQPMRHDASAMLWHSSTLRGVSIIAQMAMSWGASLPRISASSWRMESALSTFGRRMASAPVRQAATIS